MLAACEDDEKEGRLFIFPGINEVQNCRKSVGNALDALKCVGPRITYQEAIDWMDAFKRTYKGSPKEKEACEACETAISALREVQRYRQIGTVEECRKAVEKQKPIVWL